jgi:hypothetical protein
MTDIVDQYLKELSLFGSKYKKSILKNVKVACWHGLSHKQTSTDDQDVITTYIMIPCTLINQYEKYDHNIPVDDGKIKWHILQFVNYTRDGYDLPYEFDVYEGVFSNINKAFHVAKRDNQSIKKFKIKEIVICDVETIYEDDPLFIMVFNLHIKGNSKLLNKKASFTSLKRNWGFHTDVKSFKIRL